MNVGGYVVGVYECGGYVVGGYVVGGCVCEWVCMWEGMDVGGYVCGPSSILVFLVPQSWEAALPHPLILL